MADAQTAEPQRDLAARLFDAAPVPPLFAGSLLAVAFTALLLVIAWLAGDLASLAAQPEPWWQNRDTRLALLVPILTAALATALRYHVLDTRRNLLSVARLGGWRLESVDPSLDPHEGLRRRSAALVGVLAIPLLALRVDRDPSLYFQPGYWLASKVFTWLVGLLASASLGVLTWRALRDARHFSALARRLPAIDLLDPGALAPFARQGLRSAVPGLLAVSFIALNALDQGFLWAVLALGGLGLAGVTLAFAIPLRGVRARVARAKAEELSRIHAAIRGAEGALRGSAIAARAEPSLADLLAYRAQVAAFPEWPVDLYTLSRFAVYVAIPLASWIGGALVERALDMALR